MFLCMSCLHTDERNFRFCPDCGSEERAKLNRDDVLVEIPASAGVSCQSCLEQGHDLAFRRFRRVVAFVFGASLQDIAGYFCSECRSRTFFERQGTTLVTGWWGIFALFFYNPFAIMLNFYGLFAAPMSAGAMGAIDLDDIRVAAGQQDDFEELYDSIPSWLSGLSEEEVELVLARTDYYSVLGVSDTVDAEEIKSAYRRCAKAHHPDTGGSTADPEKIPDIMAANAVLGNRRLRIAYDRSRGGES